MSARDQGRKRAATAEAFVVGVGEDGEDSEGSISL
jgi:hypothetical protein